MNITVIDFDSVEPKNYSNQIFGTKHFGRKKIDCVKELVESAGIMGRFNYIDAKVDDNYDIVDPFVEDQIIVLAVDNMEARRVISEKLFTARHGALIDTRIGKELATGISINCRISKHVDRYKQLYLFKDDEAVRTSCTEKTFKGTADWASQYIVNMCKTYCVNKFEGCPQVVNCNTATQVSDKAYF